MTWKTMKGVSQQRPTQFTFKTVNPFGANWYGFLESTFNAILSFHPNSSAFCQGVFVLGNKNRILDPGRKHCQLGTGQF